MSKRILILLLFSFCFFLANAQQQKREVLEKERANLKKEIEETEKLLSENKAKTKENLLQYNLISSKVSLQDKVIENINNDIDVLDDDIYSISKEISRYDRLLDTLKQEYAKSMVFAYKNRSNYTFLNFIFSASSFNDAIKRIAYLKSYRSFREVQGQNILRMQELRRKKLDQMRGVKIKKGEVLQTKNYEFRQLEENQKEKDRILNELKKQSKILNSQIAAKQRQINKVNNAIASAIKKAQDDAKKSANAKAAAEKEKLKQEQAKNPKEEKSASKTKTTKKKINESESVLLNAENLALNSNFERNKGSLPWPLDRGIILMHYGTNTLPSGSVLEVKSVTISAEVGTSVKSVFDGTVTVVQHIDDMDVVVIQHGKYFTTYSNLTGVTVQKGQQIKIGQVLGKVAPNFDGVGAIDFYISNEAGNSDPEKWLRKK